MADDALEAIAERLQASDPWEVSDAAFTVARMTESLRMRRAVVRAAQLSPLVPALARAMASHDAEGWGASNASWALANLAQCEEGQALLHATPKSAGVVTQLVQALAERRGDSWRGANALRALAGLTARDELSAWLLRQTPPAGLVDGLTSVLADSIGGTLAGPDSDTAVNVELALRVLGGICVESVGATAVAEAPEALRTVARVLDSEADAGSEVTAGAMSVFRSVMWGSGSEVLLERESELGLFKHCTAVLEAGCRGAAPLLAAQHLLSGLTESSEGARKFAGDEAQALTALQSMADVLREPSSSVATLVEATYAVGNLSLVEEGRHVVLAADTRSGLIEAMIRCIIPTRMSSHIASNVAWALGKLAALTAALERFAELAEPTHLPTRLYELLQHPSGNKNNVQNALLALSSLAGSDRILPLIVDLAQRTELIPLALAAMTSVDADSWEVSNAAVLVARMALSERGMAVLVEHPQSARVVDVCAGIIRRFAASRIEGGAPSAEPRASEWASCNSLVVLVHLFMADGGRALVMRELTSPDSTLIHDTVCHLNSSSTVLYDVQNAAYVLFVLLSDPVTLSLCRPRVAEIETIAWRKLPVEANDNPRRRQMVALLLGQLAILQPNFRPRFLDDALATSMLRAAAAATPQEFPESSPSIVQMTAARAQGLLARLELGAE